jgi:hypothetical protein
VVDLLGGIGPICVYSFDYGRHFFHSPLRPTKGTPLILPPVGILRLAGNPDHTLKK